MNRNMGALTWAHRKTDMDNEATNIHSHVPCWGYMVIRLPAPRKTGMDNEQTNTLDHVPSKEPLTWER